MNSYVLTGVAFLYSKVLSSEVCTVLQTQESEIILEQRTEWWMIVLTMAMVLVAVTALLISFFQKKESIRAYRIALISILLGQLERMGDLHKPDDLDRWRNAIISIMAKWAPKEAREIQEELEKLSKRELNNRKSISES